jgi:hypothetical protein
VLHPGKIEDQPAILHSCQILTHQIANQTDPLPYQSSFQTLNTGTIRRWCPWGNSQHSP